MSNQVFPPPGASVGLAWNNRRSQEFATMQQRAVSGRRVAVAQRLYPIRRWKWTFKKLEASGSGYANQFRAVMSFFLFHRGSYESFLIEDTEDNQLTDQVIALTEAGRTEYQIVRGYGTGTTSAYYEPITEIKNPNSAVVKINDGTPLTYPAGFSIDAHTGVLTLVTPPGITGHTIKVTTPFYYRAHFANDESEQEQFLMTLWRWENIEMLSERR